MATTEVRDDSPGTVARLICDYLLSQGLTRVYGLCGGHIQSIWDEVRRAGIDLVDTRHEGSAVYMAHASAYLDGKVAVALLTAGPGLTNAITAVANAHISAIPVLIISGVPPRPQRGSGAMQELPQAELMRPICRRVECVTERHHVLPRLDAVLAAAQGASGRPGPSYIEFPKDLLDEHLRESDVDRRFLHQHAIQDPIAPDDMISSAGVFIADAARPLVISGRGARGSGDALEMLLDASGALLLETGDSRGWVRSDHAAHVPAMRSRVMREADLVITVGRRLDYQLGYGSPAVFAPNAAFVRIGNTFEELCENRRGDVEIRGDVRSTVERLGYVLGNIGTSVDIGWTDRVRRENAVRAERLRATMREAQSGDDGSLHPYRLLAAVKDLIDENTIVVADGGDILSFARVGLEPSTYLDCGALGCLGVGIPFAVAASLTHPQRKVIAVIGDGALGFCLAELDTARRRSSNVLFVVANNGAWNIERTDQIERYQGHVVGVELPDCRYDLVANGFGIYAEHVDDVAVLKGALERCNQHSPALLDVAIRRDVRSPDTASGLATVPLRQALRTWDDAEAARIE